jgi:uncharacterized membrane protein (DUF4010 family)
MNLELEALISRLALALGIGLLVGLERGWRTRDARPGSRTAGVRTFAIIGLLGGVIGALAGGGGEPLGIAASLLIGSSFAAVAAVLTLFGRDENRAANNFSATTTIAGLITFTLGVYALLGEARVAAAAAVATAGILMVREGLHDWVRKISLAEFESVLLLLAMTFIALPVVPDRPFGPWGGINPREIWLIAIVLAAVSFTAFIAVRWLGERRGVFVASAVGGLVSSTAVVFANARAATLDAADVRTLASGSALATAVSFIRVIAIAAALAPGVLAIAAPPLLAAAIGAIAFAFANARPDPGSPSPVAHFRNPFSLISVLGMAAAMGVILFVGRGVHAYYGVAGATMSAAISGFFDVDAMTVAMAKLTPHPLEIHLAGYAILVGVASNTLTKVMVSALLGSRRFALALCVMCACCLVAGAGTVAVLLAIR